MQGKQGRGGKTGVSKENKSLSGARTERREKERGDMRESQPFLAQVGKEHFEVTSEEKTVYVRPEKDRLANGPASVGSPKERKGKKKGLRRKKTLQVVLKEAKTE